ncbi:hypothetical protein ACFSPU_02230 [Haoranjiania flava]|uniref:Uncharacterized protein n=1 Tax=Haoranjiania flava TaxID=1856322 RepID=A0AAE3IJQ8_9BACT|nr:hypothetical protein [Haoranjiania flava]MCU7693048.1 hypothetical protein [Haoranjiania flava]
MPELIIKYCNKKPLRLLQRLSKYFDFRLISTKKDEQKSSQLYGVVIITAHPELTPRVLKAFFCGIDLNAQQLRKDTWQRSL